VPNGAAPTPSARAAARAAPRRRGARARSLTRAPRVRGRPPSLIYLLLKIGRVPYVVFASVIKVRETHSRSLARSSHVHTRARSSPQTPEPRAALNCALAGTARRNAAERSYDEEGSRRGDDAWSKIAHETNDALTLPGHARTPSGCTSGDIKRTIIKTARSLCRREFVCCARVFYIKYSMHRSAARRCCDEDDASALTRRGLARDAGFPTPRLVLATSYF
jgi:hypothetical protein